VTAKTPLSQGLPPEARLRDPRVYRAIKNQGRRMVTKYLIANWRELPDGSRSQLGLITSRKTGNAVVRSRARRLMREAFRRHQDDLSQPVTMVLIARPALAGKAYVEVEHDYLRVLKQARLLKFRS
jgi:ribonuclease P protein component